MYNKEVSQRYFKKHADEWREYSKNYFKNKYLTNEDFRIKERERKNMAYQKKDVKSTIRNNSSYLKAYKFYINPVFYIKLS